MKKSLTFSKICLLRQRCVSQIRRTVTTSTETDGKYFEFPP